ncbi:MAG: cytidylate kinase family protein [Candidatus Aenigmarchaeota archaeon]|nr:cytidylate kinase family protein [Candidatus Aenigmarchaeota archaeon]
MPKGIVIVISGQPGCGSTTTGKLLSDKLGIGFFSVGTHFKKLAGEKTKKKVGWPSPTMVSADYLSTKEGSGKKLHNDIDAMQIEKAKTGNIIIESKLGVHMLPDADFKIWLKAPIRTRAARVAERDNISFETAIKTLMKKEKQERKSFKKIYGFDFFELEKNADLVISTSSKKPEKIVNTIMSSLKARKLI